MPTVSQQKTTTKKSTPRKKGGGIEDRIEDIDFGPEKFLIYGKSATGKTRLWATFPKPILAVLTSGGKKPGELRSINTPEYRRTIKKFDLNDTEELKEVIEYQRESGKFATLVLDHITSLQDMVLREILGLEELPTQKSWGMASREQYGQCSLKTKELLRSLLNLDCRVILVAQEREFNTDPEDRELLMPFVGAALFPATVGWLNPSIDYIVQTFIRQKMRTVKRKVAGKVIEKVEKDKGVEFCLRTAPDPVFITKFRTPANGNELPEVIVNPTYEKLAKLTGGV